MKRVFDGKVWVHDSQVYFLAGPSRLPDMGPCFRGQRNGLCGAATPGVLFLMTGLHTGTVHLTVELADQAPPLDDGWEDIVEASFDVPAYTRTGLLEWGASAWHSVPLEAGRHRVRYYARNMEIGRVVDTVQDHEAPVDFYRLVFWRAPEDAADAILRETSTIAAFWHNWVRGVAPHDGESVVGLRASA